MVTMRGHINPSIGVSNVTQKDKLYEQQWATGELLWSIERTPNKAYAKAME